MPQGDVVTGRGRVIRIAHAHGNRRDKIATAKSAAIDFMEADLWYRAGEIWVRHERRLGCLPLLYDRKPEGVDGVGPWTLTVFPRHYVRLDIEPLTLTELLATTGGRPRLLLDVKDDLRGEEARLYAQTLVRTLKDAGREESVVVCGQTDLLDSVRETAPHLDVRYSIEERGQWEKLVRRLESDRGLRGVCMHHEFVDASIVTFLKESGLEVYCWTVDDPAEARRLAALGVAGIISNSIRLLERLDGHEK